MAKFKVGDKVEYVGGDEAYTSNLIGKRGVVTDVRGGHPYVTFNDGVSGYGLLSTNLRLVVETSHLVEESTSQVDHPAHYTWLGGIEVIDITERLSFTLGNVIKYVLRADHKGKPIEDLEKAQWYLAREIKRRKGETA